MCGGDKVDIVASFVLKIHHDVGQPLVFHFKAFALNADFVVLAEDAPKITVGEKYRS